jgi:hypothetical protein
MSPRVFLVLAAITVVTTVAAIFAVLTAPAVTTLRFVDEPAFPALRKNPDAVAKIVLSTPEGAITLVRETGDRWSALERFGYPVDRKRVRGLVVALADMRLIERKTARPELYERLQVEAPDAEGAKSQLVRLESADGKVLAEAIIGKQRFRLTGTEPSGTYLRRPGEPQTWLASGGVQLDPQVGAWLDDQIVDLPEEAIRRVVVKRADEPGYFVVRDSPEDPWRLAGLAQGEVARQDANLGRLTGALAGVQLEDVQPRERLTWPAQQHTARIQTFDGVELTVRLAQIDEQYWATFEARALAPPDVAGSQPEAALDLAAAEDAREATGDAAPAPQPPAEAASGGDSETAAGEQTVPEAAEGGDAGAGEEVAPEKPARPIDPEALNRQVGKWAFRIPEHVFNRLSTARSEFLRDQDGTS